MKNMNSFVKYMGWFITTFFVYFQFLIQTSSSILQAEWARYFHLSSLGVSLLSAAFFYTYLLFQIPVGVIYDRYDTRKVLASASLGLGVGCLLFASTNHYIFAILARMLMGACAAFGFLGMLKVTADYFPGKQFSLMMGFSEAFAAISTIFGVMLLAWSINYITWHTLMIYFAMGVFVVTLAVLVFVQPSENKHVDKICFLKLRTTIISAATHPTVLITGVYGFFMLSVVNCFNSLWGISFLTQAYSISAETAAKVMSTVFLGLAIGGPLNGYFSKHYGHERESMQLSSIGCALCMMIILYVSVPIYILYILFFIIGFMCATYVQAFAIVGQSVPSTIQATAMSVTNMLIMASAPVLQILVGALLDNQAFHYAKNLHESYQVALSILPAGMIVAFGLCFFIKNSSSDLQDLAVMESN